MALGQVSERDFLTPSNDLASPGKKIKVTYIVGSLRDAGAERRTLELLRHLDRKQFSPSIVLMEQAGIERARDWTDEWFVMGIPESGNSQWAMRSWSFANAIRRTSKQLRTWRSDVVHAMLPASNILGGVAARLARVPVFIGGRPCLTGIYRSDRGIVALMDKMALRLADLTVANSQAVGRDMTSVGGCPSTKCCIIYNGVDTNRFHPGISGTWRAAMGWGPEHIVLGMVANFRAYKRHADFVQAAAAIVQRYPKARFVMVGADCGSRNDVIQQVSDLGLHEQIRIVDSQADPGKIFAALDIYVSTSESEGFSNVILEAMACGKPVIATDVGGNPEAVLDGVTGSLIPCGDPGSLASAAEVLIRDPVRLRQMGVHGRERVEREFSLERMVKAHELLYSQLVGRK
jgi:glycosyltransferase involved in cell wall biosynthesis